MAMFIKFENSCNPFLCLTWLAVQIVAFFLLIDPCLVCLKCSLLSSLSVEQLLNTLLFNTFFIV